MLRILLSLLLALGSGHFGWAQSGRPDSGRPRGQVPPPAVIHLQGRVIPRRDHPQLPELMTATLSEYSGGVIQTRLVQSGLFEFKGVKAGRYVIRVECAGYQTAEKTVDLQPSRYTRQEFVMINLGERLDEKESTPPAGESTVQAGFLSVPRKAQKALERAQTASRKGRHQQAVRHLNEALKLHPDFPEAYNNLAVQYLRLGRPQDALESLSRSLQLRPTAEAYQNLGVVQMNQGRYEQAYEALRQALQLNPDDGQSIRSMGELYFRVGQYQTALEWFDKVSDEEDAMLELARGHCHLRLEHHPEALRHFETYLKLAPRGLQAKETRRLIRQLRPKNSP